MNPENKQFWTGMVVGLVAGVGLTIFFQSPNSSPYGSLYGSPYGGAYPQGFQPQYPSYPQQTPTYINPGPMPQYELPFTGIQIGLN